LDPFFQPCKIAYLDQVSMTLSIAFTHMLWALELSICQWNWNFYPRRISLAVGTNHYFYLNSARPAPPAPDAVKACIISDPSAWVAFRNLLYALGHRHNNTKESSILHIYFELFFYFIFFPFNRIRALSRVRSPCLRLRLSACYFLLSVIALFFPSAEITSLIP